MGHYPSPVAAPLLNCKLFQFSIVLLCHFDVFMIGILTMILLCGHIARDSDGLYEVRLHTVITRSVSGVMGYMLGLLLGYNMSP